MSNLDQKLKNAKRELCRTFAKAVRDETERLKQVTPEIFRSAFAFAHENNICRIKDFPSYVTESNYSRWKNGTNTPNEPTREAVVNIILKKCDEIVAQP